MSLVQLSIDDDMATITFNRDEKRNAINREMGDEILQMIDQAEARAARLIILRAHRDVKVWCAGHDLAELEPKSLRTDNPTLHIVDRIQSSPLPIIAMVQGSVYAGGLLILLSADLVVADRDVQVAITSNRLGIPLEPELYAYWLNVMGLHKTKELLFTAEPIDAQDALRNGLFNHVVDGDQLEATTLELAAKILRCTPEGVANAKFQLNTLARQTALADELRREINRRNQQVLDSPETEQRIRRLIDYLKHGT